MDYVEELQLCLVKTTNEAGMDAELPSGEDDAAYQGSYK